MHVAAFRAWFSSAIQQSVGAARRAGLAVGRRIRQATGKIDLSTSVGEDESEFGGRGSRAWLELLEEYREKLLQLFEKSTFERFPRFERFVRRILGRPATLKKAAPKLPVPRSGANVPAGRSLGSGNSDEAARLSAQVRMGMMQAHTHEHAGLREKAEKKRKSGSEGFEE